MFQAVQLPETSRPRTCPRPALLPQQCWPQGRQDPWEHRRSSALCPHLLFLFPRPGRLRSPGFKFSQLGRGWAGAGRGRGKAGAHDCPLVLSDVLTRTRADMTHTWAEPLCGPWFTHTCIRTHTPAHTCICAITQTGTHVQASQTCSHTHTRHSTPPAPAGRSHAHNSR